MKTYWFNVVRISDGVQYDTVEASGTTYAKAFLNAVDLVKSWENGADYFIPAYVINFGV